MSGGPPPNYYGFSTGPPYYPTGIPPLNPGAPPTHFPSAPFPGIPQQPGGLPTYVHPPQHFSTMSHSVTNYFPAGETQFSNSVVSQSHAQSFSPGLRWVHWQRGNMLPAHAVEGGYDVDRAKIYVGRLHHKGDLLPAKVIPQRNIAYVCYNGTELAFHACEILCQERVNWVHEGRGRVPAGAMPAGRTSTGENLYIGRVYHNGSLTIGKVHPSHGVCYIPFDGKEVPHHNYEVLTL